MDYINAAHCFDIIERRSQAYIVAACAELGLTYAEYVLLHNLYDHTGSRQDDLAEMLCVDKAAITRTLKLLEGKGLIKRLPGEQDKRVKYVYPSEKGLAQEVFLRRVLQRWLDYLAEGVEYNFSEAITGKVVLDGARKSEASEYTAFLKIAQLDWKLNDKALLSMGMIGLKQFDTQEKFWGYRYVYKDFQDEFGFGTSADLGCNLEYTFNSKVMANLFVLNGEGFTRVQDSNGKIKVGGSVIYEPVKGLLLKGYYSIYDGQQANAAGELRDTAAIQNYEVFAGYKTEKFRVGVGYNIQENGKSFYQVAEDYKMQGFTLSGAYAINKKY
ncbi:MAG: MarR family winged helix-turn-helix transcriptional regulator, partial [Selenomonadaceae bacterium]